ncbi:hypothetical protein [Virgibacillus phasianinus]|uniref:hypothetical protein n=1 Tax=Virgibacillus phasianinus TaxID=2017483 RepID=UPI001C12BABE|nr:hypothetical protein [Virgibacillus phasianinus]
MGLSLKIDINGLAQKKAVCCLHLKRENGFYDNVIKKSSHTELTENASDLFLQWLYIAIEDGVCEPDAMTLSTVDKEGAPDGGF